MPDHGVQQSQLRGKSQPTIEVASLHDSLTSAAMYRQLTARCMEGGGHGSPEQGQEFLCNDICEHFKDYFTLQNHGKHIQGIIDTLR